MEPAAPTPRPGIVTLIGTGHVFDIGARVREEIRRRQPRIVGIELDPPRYHALRNKTKDKKGLPFAYRMLADFQTRIANQYGVEAGDEMLAASEEARALGIPLALIDADAQKTFARLRSEMKFSEKMRLVGSLVASVFIPGRSIDKQVDEMQDDYAYYFAQMGDKFPTLKRVLLDERNEHMARALADMMASHPSVIAPPAVELEYPDVARVVAVMGDGHVDGVRDILTARGIEVETVRLRDLRHKEPEAVGTATASIAWDVPSEAPPPRE